MFTPAYSNLQPTGLSITKSPIQFQGSSNYDCHRDSERNETVPRCDNYRRPIGPYHHTGFRLVCRAMPSAQGTLSGAGDNASGVAGVLSLASAFARMESHLPRSIVFFLPTLEERNLLGSEFYVTHPVLPIVDTLAVLKLEMVCPWGPSKQMSRV